MRYMKTYRNWVHESIPDLKNLFRHFILTVAHPRRPPSDENGTNHKSLKLDQYTCVAYQNVRIEEQNSYLILNFTCIHPTSCLGCFSNMAATKFDQKGSF